MVECDWIWSWKHALTSLLASRTSRPLIQANRCQTSVYFRKTKFLLTYEIVHSTFCPLNHPKLWGNTMPPEKSNSEPLSSIKFRNATMPSINVKEKRSTMSANRIRHQNWVTAIVDCNGLPAQVIWNKLSFSNFLKTLPFISTNWLETRRVRSEWSKELIATFKDISW